MDIRQYNIHTMDTNKNNGYLLIDWLPDALYDVVVDLVVRERAVLVDSVHSEQIKRSKSTKISFIINWVIIW